MSPTHLQHSWRPGRDTGVVIGCSAGGLEALTSVLTMLPPDFNLPILVVQHLHPDDRGAFASHLATLVRLPVIEPCDKESIKAGQVHVAPANYHMLVEKNSFISLSVDEKVNYSRPSIDVLFQSAARAWGAATVAVILSGASADGTKGLGALRAAGGLTIAQDLDEAKFPFMPKSAIDGMVIDRVMKTAEIGWLLQELAKGKQPKSLPNPSIGTDISKA